ncbi:hypothetical protein ABXV22_07090 [Vibrio rotiferianus]|uniref:hypothetical protein n=1 Tax=Vibrio rotiferianus TaxID=190895 RepID=UPI00339B0AE4
MITKTHTDLIETLLQVVHATGEQVPQDHGREFITKMVDHVLSLSDREVDELVNKRGEELYKELDKIFGKA